MERAPLGFCLMLRTPPGTPATHVRPRPGHEHGPGTTPSIFVEPPINAFTHMRATSRRRPVRSSPRPHPRDGTSGASALTLSFAPHRHQQRTSGAGTGHRARTWNNAYDISRTSDLACSLNTCDLASHGDKQVDGRSDCVALLSQRDRHRSDQLSLLARANSEASPGARRASPLRSDGPHRTRR
jgi:hypothetical protein